MQKNITTLNIPLKGILAALPYVDDGAFQPWEIALAYALDGYKPIDIMFTTRSAHVRVCTAGAANPLRLTPRDSLCRSCCLAIPTSFCPA